MVNETDIIQQVDLNKGVDYVSYLSQTTTGQIVEWLATKGINVSVRWASLLVLFISLGLIWLAMKISKPIVKWVLIGLGVLLILGLIIPW